MPGVLQPRCQGPTPQNPAGPIMAQPRVLEKSSEKKAEDLESSLNTAIYLLCNFRQIAQPLRGKFPHAKQRLF